MTRTYTVVLLKEQDDRYSVQVPAIRGCHTMGDNVDEALTNAKEAIELHLESLAAHGEAIPEEGELLSFRVWDAEEAIASKVTVEVPASTPRGEVAAVA